MNVIIDDMMIIYYNETEDEVHRNLIREMRRSPYRNYVKSEEFHENDVVIRPEDTNKVVQELKKQYEPVTFRLRNAWYNEKKTKEKRCEKNSYKYHIIYSPASAGGNTAVPFVSNEQSGNQCICIECRICRRIQYWRQRVAAA